MTETAFKEKRKFGLFVSCDLDDYGLDTYEFRLYARISRRAGNGEAWETISNMARACCMAISRARKALRLLELAGLIENIERPGYSTLRRLTPQHKWVAPERLQELRKTLTPTKNSTPLPDLTPLPLPDLIDEGIPSEVIPNNKNPLPPLTPPSPVGLEGGNFDVMAVPTGKAQSLTEYLTQLVQSTLVPIFTSLVEETKVLLSEAVQSTPNTKAKTKNSTIIASTLSQLQFLEELALLVNEPVESLRLNPNLAAAVEQHPGNVEDAWVYFKQASATWSSKPGLGLFISAIRKGLKPNPTKPGSGWKEWADEAKRRRLMEYSQSSNSDISIYFINGVQQLWSEVRSLSWSEVEAIALPQGSFSKHCNSNDAIAQNNCFELNIA